MLLALAWHFFLIRTEIGVMITDILGFNEDTSMQVWTGYNFFIAFLLTFRAGKSYTRWWEGATLLRQCRGEWFNAYSSLIAFSASARRTKAKDVHDFQRMLATLFSQLFCAALNTVSQMEDNFSVLNLATFKEGSVDFLTGTEDKIEVIVLWIQRLIVGATETGTITVAPPVLSRVFQELSRGVVNCNDVRKISEYLYPFPYAQLTSCALLMHTALTPLFTALAVDSWVFVALHSFFGVFAFQSLNYIAMEMECPFGDDENDLPMHDMQNHFNLTLMMLLEEKAQLVPFMEASAVEEASGGSSPKIIKDFIRHGARPLAQAMSESDHERNMYRKSRNSILSLSVLGKSKDRDRSPSPSERHDRSPENSYTGGSDFGLDAVDSPLKLIPDQSFDSGASQGVVVLTGAAEPKVPTLRLPPARRRKVSIQVDGALRLPGVEAASEAHTASTAPSPFEAALRPAAERGRAGPDSGRPASEATRTPDLSDSDGSEFQVTVTNADELLLSDGAVSSEAEDVIEM